MQLLKPFGGIRSWTSGFQSSWKLGLGLWLWRVKEGEVQKLHIYTTLTAPVPSKAKKSPEENNRKPWKSLVEILAAVYPKRGEFTIVSTNLDFENILALLVD